MPRNCWGLVGTGENLWGRRAPGTKVGGHMVGDHDCFLTPWGAEAYFILEKDWSHFHLFPCPCVNRVSWAIEASIGAVQGCWVPRNGQLVGAVAFGCGQSWVDRLESGIQNWPMSVWQLFHLPELQSAKYACLINWNDFNWRRITTNRATPQMNVFSTAHPFFIDSTQPTPSLGSDSCSTCGHRCTLKSTCHRSNSLDMTPRSKLLEKLEWSNRTWTQDALQFELVKSCD